MTPVLHTLIVLTGAIMEEDLELKTVWMSPHCARHVCCCSYFIV